MSKTVLLVSHDKKTTAQISRWVKELPEDVVCDIVASLDELNEKYLSRISAEQEVSVESKKEILRLIVFDVAMFGSTDPVDYISQTKNKLQNSFFCSPEAPLKIMILSFDNSNLPVRTFIHPDIDDLVMKPLDHQLFLQKAGMMLADKTSTEGNFLFKQKANFTIEMAKEARIVKLSEFGLVISNPTPLAPGVFAHLYASLFGEKTKSSVWARVFNTRRDPKKPGNYLCFFTFFGMQADQLMVYRRALRDRRKEIRYFKTGYDKNRIPAAVRHIVIIDRNTTNASLVAEALSTNFLNLKTYSYSSYAQFLKAVSGSAVSTIPLHEGQDEKEILKAFNGSQISFYVTHDTADLVKVDPPIRGESHFCGVALQEIEGTNKWLDSLVQSEKAEWEEFLLSLQRGRKSQVTLYFKGSGENQHALFIQAETDRKGSGDGSRLLRLDIRELSNDELETENERRRQEQSVFPQVDAIYIDALSIREFENWYGELKNLLQQSNLLIGDKLPICLLIDDKSVDLANYRINGIADVMFKPVDRRFVAAKAPVLVSDLVAANDSVDLSFTPADYSVKIAKEVKLSEVAEFGFQVTSNVPLRENIFLRFFSPLFLDETGDGVLGRCTACVQDETDKNSYGCFFTFFGVSDAQLKHIRNWIREDYVSKKDSEAG